MVNFIASILASFQRNYFFTFDYVGGLPSLRAFKLMKDVLPSNVEAWWPHGSSPDRAVRIRALAKDIVLCS